MPLTQLAKAICVGHVAVPLPVRPGQLQPEGPQVLDVIEVRVSDEQEIASRYREVHHDLLSHVHASQVLQEIQHAGKAHAVGWELLGPQVALAHVEPSSFSLLHLAVANVEANAHAPLKSLFAVRYRRTLTCTGINETESSGLQPTQCLFNCHLPSTEP